MVSEKIFKGFCYQDKPCSVVAMFLLIKFNLAIFVEGHLVIISAKLFLFLTTGFIGEDVLSFLRNWPHPLAAMFFNGSNLF